jgi:hypothetical protein
MCISSVLVLIRNFGLFENEVIISRLSWIDRVKYQSRQIIVIFQVMDTFASASTVNELSLKPAGNKVLDVEHDLYLSNISKE